ncbi:MAG: AcrB/AcrD/AcrF family protein, partial [Sphingomonas sp.]
MRHEPSLHAAAPPAIAPTSARSARRWRRGLVALWLAACAWAVAGRLDAIRALRLPDGDDALRLLQVRDWLGGQGWFDLRQYRLDPPAGADIHWSRLVDLPLAAVIAPLRPLFGQAAAEMAAVTLAPLVTLGAAMLVLALLARRLIDPRAWWWAPLLLLAASPPLDMMAPLRIDHHGWQIVAVLTALLGLVAEDRRRGGIAAGLAIAGSLAIGVEMLPCLALGVALAAIGWLADEREGARLRWLCLAAGVGTLAGLFVFAPPAARFGAACDALSAAYAAPLWAGGALLAAGTLRGRTSAARAGWIAAAGLAAGAMLLVLDAGACLTDPYHAVDPAARALWLDRVSEAKPLWRQPPEVLWASLALPLIGLGGAMLMLARAGRDMRRPWGAALALAALAILLALVSTRAAVAAQALALPGAAALGWRGRARLAASASAAVRV